MRLLRILLWLVAASVILVFASLYIMGHYDVSGYLTSLFWVTLEMISKTILPTTANSLFGTGAGHGFSVPSQPVGLIF